jgi:hypothetical protein
MFKLNVRVVLGIVLVAAAAWGSPLTVSNFSFESPVLVSGATGVSSTLFGLFGFGNAIVGGIPNWTITSGASTTGIYQPNTSTPFTPNVAGPVATGATGVPNGNQVAFLLGGGSIYQDLTPVAGNGFYSVSVDVGRRTDVASGAYSLILTTSGGTSLATFTGDVSSIGSGLWARETVTFNGAALAAGQSLRLTLTAAGNQVAFDNVQAEAAPEIGGSAVFWTMLGVAAFWIYRKKRLVA